MPSSQTPATSTEMSTFYCVQLVLYLQAPIAHTRNIYIYMPTEPPMIHRALVQIIVTWQGVRLTHCIKKETCFQSNTIDEVVPNKPIALNQANILGSAQYYTFASKLAELEV